MFDMLTFAAAFFAGADAARQRFRYSERCRADRRLRAQPPFCR